MVRTPTIGTLLLLAAFALVGCSDAGSPDPLAPNEISAASTGPVLIECPSADVRSTAGVLGATGGFLQLDGHRLHVPRLALTAPNEFRIATPASTYMELAVNARGFDTFQFRRTASITIDYSRCTRDNIDHSPLSVWHIDPETKELLEHMGGVDNKVTRTITFETDHLSTFSIAR